MAYCKSCGAYIPDGQTKCLACGYDEAEKKRDNKQYNSGNGSAYQTKNDEHIEQLRKNREKQKEESRRWAEQEKARRDAQRVREAEERARRAEERARKAEERAGETTYKSAWNRQYSQSAGPLSNKNFAALSYFSILFILPSLLCPNDAFARFHAQQGMRLFVFGIVSDIIGAIFPIGLLLTLFRFYCVFKGVSNVNKGIMEELPYIGNIGK